MRTLPKVSLVIGALIVIGCFLGMQMGEGVRRDSAEMLAQKPVRANLAATLASRGQSFLPQLHWGKASSDSGLHSDVQKSIAATAVLEPSQVAAMRFLSTGDRLIFPTGNAEDIAGTINLIIPNDAGRRMVGGGLDGSARGEFSLAQDLKTGAWSGMAIDRVKQLVFQIETTATAVLVHKRSLDSVMCAMPRPPNRPEPSLSPTASAPQAITVPALESRPTASGGVIYLDFDGETVTDPDWNSGVTINAAAAVVNGIAITSTQITDVWNRVSEDFRPFDVNVTTSRMIYDSAPVGHRALVVITPSGSWYPARVGGVAYIRSYRGPASGFSSSIPCWVFNNYNTSDMALTVSHEVGHMVGLHHDGRQYFGSTYETYYGGHDSGIRSWGPIMGAPWNMSMTQWSKCEYPEGNNTGEDDLDVASKLLAEPGFGNLYVPDEDGNTPATAVALPFTSPFTKSGIISSPTDTDIYYFKTSGGSVSFTVNPSSVDPDLDPDMELRDSTGVLIAAATHFSDTLLATLTATITTTGTYYLHVKGRGNPAGLGVIGYTNYGSLGPYTISGYYSPLPEKALITLQPVSKSVARGAKVILTAAGISNSTLTYQWWHKVNGVDTKVTNAITNTLTIASAQPADVGDYWLEFINAAGSSYSNAATVTVLWKPLITAQPSPAKLTVPTGADASFAVSANASAPISYQWKKNNTVIPGETGPSLALHSVDWFSTGSYSVAVTNPLGTVASAAATLTVLSSAIINPQPPANYHLAVGGSGSVTVAAVGTAPLSYQWYQNGAKVPGGTTAKLVWTAAKATNAGDYFLRVTNVVGPVDSAIIHVDVLDKPVLDTHPPAALTLDAGLPLELHCTAHGGGTLQYQWQLNNLPVPNGNSKDLLIPAAEWIHHGIYRCIVSNEVGSTVTKNSLVTVVSAPVIVTPPANTKVAINGTAKLTVVAGGTGTLKYQWYRAGVPITGAVASSLTLTKASIANTAGLYTVTVTNTTGPKPGSATSNPAAMVSVLYLPTSGAPTPASSTIGIGDAVTFSAVAGGDPPLRFQWQRNNLDLPGETQSTLILANVTTTQSGAYRLVVSNDVGKVYSAAAKLSVLIKPAITKQPVNSVVFETQSATFTVAATGSPTLTYRWLKNGQPITGNATALTAALKLVNVVKADPPDQYSVVVSNAAASATSDPATLTVLDIPDPEISDLRPKIVVVGSKILITGTGLDWTTGIKLAGKPIAFVKNRITELQATIPAGSVSGDLVLTSKGGGEAKVAMTVLPTKGPVNSIYAPNDDMMNASLLFGIPVWVDSNHSNATAEASEYTYAGHTTWTRWRAHFNGKININSYGTDFDHHVWVYTGPANATSPLQLTYLGGFENDPQDEYVIPSIDIKVIQGEEYYACIDGKYYYSILDSVYKTGRVGFYKSYALDEPSQDTATSASVGPVQK